MSTPAIDPRQMREPTETELAGGKGWAWRLRQRELDGDKLGICQRRFWREALGIEIELQQGAPA